MLVVLGIIAVLAAIITPAVMYATVSARNAAIGVEVKSLDDGVNGYFQKHQDYPPNFRDYQAFLRHVRKCYPKIDSTPGGHLDRVVGVIWPGYTLASPPPSPSPMDMATGTGEIDEGESLVFWLHLVDNDPRYPFKAADPTYTPNATAAEALLAAGSPERHFPFKEDRFVNDDGDRFPSYRALHSKTTCYIYIDRRSYDYFVTDFSDPDYAAYAEGPSLGFTRPYWSEQRSTTTATPTGPLTLHFKPVNPTTFQIICAGQDGDFGGEPASAGAPAGVKFFPGGGNTGGSGLGYLEGDRDNLTNFTEGRRLIDHIP
jgi:type II secretory pathway pseudopilin PulG